MVSDTKIERALKISLESTEPSGIFSETTFHNPVRCSREEVTANRLDTIKWNAYITLECLRP